MNKNGFSLLEVIVAIFIISTALVISLTVIQATISASQLSANKLVAVNLAQEGIEIVRNIRDAQTDWTSWYDTFLAEEEQNYLVQYDSSDFMSYNHTPLKLDNGFYKYSLGNETPFYRRIYLTKTSDTSEQEIKVISEVTWRHLGRNYKVEVEDRLWNWQQVVKPEINP